MRLVIPFSAIGEDYRTRVGPKAYVLAKLTQMQLSIPRGSCISVDGYRDYVRRTGLLERVMLELNRKPFNEMRWEELWDASLRIRNMFLTTAIPVTLDRELRDGIAKLFAEKAVAGGLPRKTHAPAFQPFAYPSQARLENGPD